MAAVELDPNNSWTHSGPAQWSERRGLRSRYSGYPLLDDKMIVTILSQGSFTLGHQVICFEWADHQNLRGEGSYRKHKMFHLYPAVGQSVTELGFTGSSWAVVPGRIERGRSISRDESGVAHSVDKHLHGNEAEAQMDGFLTKNGRYRSWEVDFADGWNAFQAAKQQWKNASLTPSFNLLSKFGGLNCGTWVQSIASIAGIPSTSKAAAIGFPVPKNEVETGGAIKSESEMWSERKSV